MSFPRSKSGGNGSPYPSQEVNALRKSGKLDEAYDLAVRTIESVSHDKWNVGALGWCLIDLVKRHADDPESDAFQRYLRELTELDVSSNDEILHTHRERILSLSSEAGQKADRARQAGKAGRHEEAVSIFTDLARGNELREADKLSFGWELSHAIQQILKSGNGKSLSAAPIGKVRRYLNLYFKLGLTGPHLLHSRIAQQALPLAKEGHLKFLPFIRMWNLDTLRHEDHDRFQMDDGKTLPSLTERVAQLAAKEAISGSSNVDLGYILTHLETIAGRFPDNVWLKMYRAKILARLGREGEARALAVEFVRAKSREFWAWELLGDLVVEPDVKTACYAKSLQCSSDEDFVGKVRLKFAECIGHEFPAQARGEIERVLRHKANQGHRIPKIAEDLSHQSWFMSAAAEKAEVSFYANLSTPADEYLLAQLPIRLAAIDHVNIERGLFHYIVDKMTDGVAPLSMYDGPLSVGEVVLVRVDSVARPQGSRTTLLSIEPSGVALPAHLGRQFEGEVRVSNGMGFMPDDIFIPRDIVSKFRLEDGTRISGQALINYDKKKARWGLKAISVKPL